MNYGPCLIGKMCPRGLWHVYVEQQQTAQTLQKKGNAGREDFPWQ